MGRHASQIGSVIASLHATGIALLVPTVVASTTLRHRTDD